MALCDMRVWAQHMRRSGAILRCRAVPERPVMSAVLVQLQAGCWAAPQAPDWAQLLWLAQAPAGSGPPSPR